jgi:hypothetical protein
MLWAAVLALPACSDRDADRAGSVQLLLGLAVLLMPLLSVWLGPSSRRRLAGAVLLQGVLYAAYESGVSSRTDIRIDLLLLVPALLVHLLLALWFSRPQDPP